MNKKIIALVGAASVSLFAAGSLWPAAGLNSTQLSTGGYFYGYADGDDPDGPGTSSFEWDNGLGEYEDPQLNSNGSLPITLKIGPGATDPFAALGANFGDLDTDEHDFSAKTGLCVTYTASAPVVFELKSGTMLDMDEPDRYNNPVKVMPAATTPTVMNLAWEDLKQGTGWGTQVPITTVTPRVTSIAIKVEKVPARTVNLAVYELGFHGECTGAAGGGTPVLNKIAGSAVSANLSGRTISFANLGKNSLNYELIGLNGQVVSQGVVSAAKNTVNLNKAGNGVYILRATSKDVNFSKMLTLN